jgi:hypothetical protein
MDRYLRRRAVLVISTPLNFIFNASTVETVAARCLDTVKKQTTELEEGQSLKINQPMQKAAEAFPSPFYVLDFLSLCSSSPKQTRSGIML